MQLIDCLVCILHFQVSSEQERASSSRSGGDVVGGVRKEDSEEADLLTDGGRVVGDVDNAKKTVTGGDGQVSFFVY